jgi:hypothetical protein
VGGFHAIMKKLMDAVERSPDRLIADAKEKSKKVPAKSCPVTKRHPNCSRRLATEDPVTIQKVPSSEARV